ncbi:sprT domain-containing protein [Spirosoma montaniterrae]|uniref:SprT-like domain-containing protein n=1 Tax=Spirosoma montaniterrae TaxID=1178516 RepID=A0A1P9X4S6_9BACT|nr:sprT domain-containing protein [Spirosoma montaniterrae]AQG82598.1 hypothetical protein AWR27_19745 [Spirosoma montaniterrae]
MADSFQKYFPSRSIPYCQQLWQQYDFVFRVVKPRRSRFGDFRTLPTGQIQITVNADLNPYAFLITYIHEVAHADVYRNYRRLGRPLRTRPHGNVWQTAFQRLMQPLLTEAVFPVSILNPLIRYMQKPAATTAAHPALISALRLADRQPLVELAHKQTTLGDLPEGTSFQLAKKTFVRGTMRRTRVVCKEIGSGRSYAILAHAVVEVKN